MGVDDGGAAGPDAGDDPLLVAVGSRIRDLRVGVGLTPKDFAARAGFTLSYLWRLEGGRQNLSLRSISRIALALGVPMAALLDGVDADPRTLGSRPWTPRRRTDED